MRIYQRWMLTYFRILFFIISWAKRHVKIKFVLIQLKIKRHWNSFYRNWFNLGKNLWSTIRLQFRYKTYINACEGGNINSFCRRFTKEFFLKFLPDITQNPPPRFRKWMIVQSAFFLFLPLKIKFQFKGICDALNLHIRRMSCRID